jgi:hypothetical protein
MWRGSVKAFNYQKKRTSRPSEDEVFSLANRLARISERKKSRHI